jgi:hypothetical protein
MRLYVLAITLALCNLNITTVCDTQEPPGLPSCQVRQPRIDVTAALSHCAQFTSGWVILVEYDCEACAGALDEVEYTLASLDHH